MRRANRSNQAYTGKTWLLAIAGSAVLLLSSVLSNPIIQSTYGQPSSAPQDQDRAIDDDPPGVIEEERLREDLGAGIGHLEFEKRPELAEVRFGGGVDDRKAPPAITGDNIYVAWWTNTTGNDEVMFRASTDVGETFGESINLSNTTDADSTRAEIDSDADSVVVTWWETNQTDDTPVMRVSNDNGATFGPVLTLAINGTLGEAVEGEDEG
jgi:hypothetical protein